MVAATATRPSAGRPDPESTLSTTVRLSEIAEGSCRLDAGAYSVTARNAAAAVRASGLPHAPLYLKDGVGGITGEAHNAFQFARTYVEPEHGVGFLSSSDIIKLDPTPTKWVSRKRTPKLNRLLIRRHDVLISCSGTVGNVALAGDDLTGLALTQHALRVRPGDAERAGFVAAFLRSRYGRPQLTGAAYGSVITHIEPHHLARVACPDPQPMLAAKYGRPMVAATADRDAANRLFREARAALRDDLGLPPFRTFRRSADAGRRTVRARDLADRFEARYHAPLPAAVEAAVQSGRRAVVPLGELPNVETWAVTKFRKRTWVKRGGIRLLGGKEMLQYDPVRVKRIASKAHEKDMPEIGLREGLILVTCGGTVGRVQIIPAYMNGWAGSQDSLRVSAATERDRGVLFAWLRSGYGHCLLTRLRYGATSQKVDLDMLRSVLIPQPSPSIAAAVGAKVAEGNRLRDRAWRAEREAIEGLETLIAG